MQTGKTFVCAHVRACVVLPDHACVYICVYAGASGGMCVHERECIHVGVSLCAYVYMCARLCVCVCVFWDVYLCMYAYLFLY